MIKELQRLAQGKGDNIFFYAQGNKTTLSFSYRQTRFAAAVLAHEIEKRGIAATGFVACNLFNGPEFVFLALAAAYGNFTLAVLNPRLSEDEQRLRKIELESATKNGKVEVLTEAAIDRMFLEAAGISLADLAHLEGVVPNTAYAKDIFTYAAVREDEFDPSRIALIMFTSGTSGTPKASQLSWANIMGSANAANVALTKPGRGVWQLVLPMCHIGGFQVMVRSLLNDNAFILYKTYQPARVLNDVLTYKVTHISVVDKILVDLIEQDSAKIISQYSCILLGGAALNQKTIRKALRVKANVFASYGMTETSSMIACAPIVRGFDGGLRLLPGYKTRIMRPDNKGVGLLHVTGPGVFAGYLNARSAFSADNWFVTGDRAVVDKDGFLYVFERSEDLIISGGENIYPAEVREALLRVPGISDACVFGTADETWGYRPVAFVQADYSKAAIRRDHEILGLSEEETGIHAATCAQEYVRMVHAYLEMRMSHLQHPKHIFALDALPRTTVGKTDVQALKQLYDRRLDIKSISLYRIKQPFKTPVKTSQQVVSDRESFFVEIEDWAGRRGIAECVSFATNWYLPETIAQDYRIVKEHIAPLVMDERYLHPSEVSRSLATFPALASYPMAKAAVEPAFWDLYGKITGEPLYELIGGKTDKRAVGGGVVIGIMSDDDTLRAVDKAVAAGYGRVKIKISPNSALEKIERIRTKYPDLSIFLDANQSFTEEHRDILYKFDALDITCIEEPLDPEYVPAQGAMSLLERLSLLQETLKTPICLDESVVTAADMEHAMSFTNLRCYAVKLSKFGGVQPALDFCTWARDNNIQVWMGGMFDTGVSKRLHAAFETLSWVNLSGDISDYHEYFEDDCGFPPLLMDEGNLLLNEEGYEAGLGCVLNKSYLKKCKIDEICLVK